MPTLIFVEWFDSSMQSGDIRERDLEPHTVLHSAGLLIPEKDERYISLAADAYEGCDYGHWRYVSHIPKVNVIRSWTVEVPDGEHREGP